MSYVKNDILSSEKIGAQRKQRRTCPNTIQR